MEDDGHIQDNEWVDTNPLWICMHMLDIEDCKMRLCCEGCYELGKRKGWNALRDIWNHLPKLFDLSIESWPKVEVDMDVHYWF